MSLKWDMNKVQTRDGTRYALDVIDEKQHLWDRLNVVVQGNFTRECHERVSSREARQDSLVSGVLLCSARNLLFVSDIFSRVVSVQIPSSFSFRTPIN